MTPIPQNSIYSNIIDSYFGNLTTDAKDQIWQSFLQSSGLTSNPANTNITAATAFSKFVQGTYTISQNLNLSPMEVIQRHLIYSVYQIIIELLKASQQNAQVIGQNLVYLQNFEKAYTDQQVALTKNFYIASPSDTNTPTVNSSDLSKWTLGYAGITMQDYLTTTIKNQTVQPPPVLTLSSVPPANYFTFTPTATGMDISFTATVSGTNTVMTTVTFGATDSYVSKLSNATKQFLQLYNTTVGTTGQTVAQLVADPNHPIGNNWPPSNTNSSLSTIQSIAPSDTSTTDQAVAQERATRNSLLQQYTSNIQSRIQVVQNSYNAEEGRLSQAQQEVSGLGSVLDSTIQQLRTILNGLFR